MKKDQLQKSEPKSRPRLMSAIVTSTSDTVSERRMENITEGLSPQYFNLLHRILPVNKENVLTVCDYVFSLKSEVNLSDHYRQDVIVLLCKFSTYFNNTKTFKETARKDLLLFLDSFRKAEAADPLHKWIGTYNTYRIHLVRFFKWLYNPDIEPEKRPKPEVAQNIPRLKRKEKSIYKTYRPLDSRGRFTISEILP